MEVQKIALLIACLVSKKGFEWDRGWIFFGPPTLTCHNFAASWAMIIILVAHLKALRHTYLHANNLINSKAALLRYVIPIWIISILYHKLQKKSPVFLQATVQPICIYYIRQERWPVSPTMPSKDNYTRIHSKEL